MTQNSYPKVNAPFTDDEWKNLFLTLGRGIIDKGGSPYKLTTRDSVTNTVTIAVDTREGRNWAVLDGFMHHMDAAENVPVPAVTVDTTYEIGLVYDPLKHADAAGPVTLTSWVTPADTSTGKSYLVLYRMTRKPNLALGSTPYTVEVPRAVPVFSVSEPAQLPKSSLVLVDSIGVARTTGGLYRADIAADGTVSWTSIGASEMLSKATHTITPDTLVKRYSDGSFSVPTPAQEFAVANKGYVDGKTWPGHAITSRIPFEHVDGSFGAYNNTNLGSTWATVAVNSDGFLGRYPSALKYKKNVRSWGLDAQTAYGVTPVKYEDSQNGDTRVGFVADSYVQTIPELVETNPDTGEVEGWKYMLTCVLQQVAIRDLNDRVKALEEKLGGSA